MPDYLKEWLSDPAVQKVVASVVGLLIIGFVVQLLHRTVTHRIQQTDARHRVRKLINSAGYLAGFLLIAFVVAKERGHLTIAVGVATAAVAFSLQEVIASIAGWVEISFGRFYQVGDRVELGGIVGDVIDVGVLRTTLFELGQWVRSDQHNGRIVRVANSLVFQGPVFNYSADFPFLWDEVTVPVKYGGDRHLAREILQRVTEEIAGPYVPTAQVMRDKLVKKYMIEPLGIEPVVTMIANDNWIEYTARYVVDYRKRRRTKDQIYERILDEFDRSEGRVTIASTTVQLVDPPLFDVRLGKGRKNVNLQDSRNHQEVS
jgi:small-conductance mechanosensitive channel